MEFYDSLTHVVREIKENERLFLGGDFNGHVGERIHGFEGVHGSFGYGSRNAEGEYLLEFAISLEMVIINN